MKPFDAIDFIRANVVMTGEAAEIFGVSPQRVRKLIADGKLETIRSEGSTHLLYRPYVEQKKIELQAARKKYRPYEVD